MSEYIVISGKLKNSRSRIILSSFERGSALYELISEHGFPENGAQLDKMFILEILEDVRKNINKYEIMIDGFKTIANPGQSIDDYVDLVKKLQVFKDVKATMDFIKDIVDEISNSQYEEFYKTPESADHFAYLEILRQ